MEIKKYTIEFKFNDDGSTELSRTNDGFSPFELLGLLEMAQIEILGCLKDTIKPDIIKRQVIKD